MQQCSFCGRDVSNVSRLVRSPIRKNTYICDTCNSLITSLIEDGIEDEEGWRERMRGKTHPSRHRASADKSNSELCTLKPSEIHRELDRFIIGQEKAKKALSVAIYNHTKRLNDESGLIKKSNILLVGSSGSGKTLLAKNIAKILNVPFTIIDATKITPSGFTGNDVEICLQQLLVQAKEKRNIKLAERGIVFIDEIDKLAKTNEHTNQSGGGSNLNAQTQASLLKLIEGCENITLPAIGKINSTSSSLITMDTKNILFICGGAFTGINESKQSGPIGFHTSDEDSEERSSSITHESIIDYGLMGELVGRLPVLIELDDLEEDDLVRILTEPEDNIIKEYQLLFEKDGINLHFEDEALHEIAKKALANKTGARGLRTILEDVLMDIMYDIPNLEDISDCLITKDTIATKVPVLLESQQTSELCLNNA